LIQVSSHEILLSDALRLARKAAIDEVPVTLEVTSGVPHVFQVLRRCWIRETLRLTERRSSSTRTLLRLNAA
jgi:acetyl esterase/lipase